jgi:L-seryl-tRNA(Ser) seleniumtransferase
MLMGHMVNYGAPVEQAIRLAGAIPVPVGSASGAALYQLEGAISEHATAALYVVSHHTVQYGMIPLGDVVAVCHSRGVPVIVDAASEYDLRGFLASGADLVIYSGHKFLGAPTSGIIAGRKDLVRAAFLQNCGIGRGMKVGKESIAGLIAALEAWEQRDHAAIRAKERAVLDLWKETLDAFPSIHAAIVPDPTGNPLERLEVRTTSHANFTIIDLAAALRAGNPPVIVRDDEIDRGFFRTRPLQSPSRRGGSRRDQVQENSQRSHSALSSYPRSCSRTFSALAGLTDMPSFTLSKDIWICPLTEGLLARAAA